MSKEKYTQVLVYTLKMWFFREQLYVYVYLHIYIIIYLIIKIK